MLSWRLSTCWRSIGVLRYRFGAIRAFNTSSEDSKFGDLIRKFGIKPAIGTRCFSGNIWEKLLAIHNAGFMGVEIDLEDLRKVESLDEVYKYCCELNLVVTGVQPFRNLGGWYCNEEFYAKIDELKKTFIIMNQLCTDKLIICSNVLRLPSSDMDTIVRQFKTASQLAAKRGIRLAYENLSWATNVKTVEKLCEIVENVDEPNFGICLDSFHIHVNQSRLDDLPILKLKLFGVQLCDAPTLTLTDLPFYAENYRVFPFQGNFPNLVEDLEIIHNTKFDGWLTLEVFNKCLIDSNQNLLVAEDGMRSLIYLQGKYSDKTFKTNYFPPVKINLVQLHRAPGNNSSAGVVEYTDAGFKDITVVTSDTENLNTRLTNLAYHEYMEKNNITVATECLSPITELRLEVYDPFEYNQWVFFLKTCFNMEPISSPENRATDIGLPRTQAFGYPDGNGLKVTLNIKNHELELVE